MRSPTAALLAVVLVLPLAASASNAPKSATFKDPSTGKTCAVTGMPGAKDPVENGLKNRATKPGATTATTVAEFRNLPVHDKAARSTWSAADLATFKKLEDAP